jgi:hypothetical protein
MRYYDAAVQVLKSAKRPLTARQIFEQAVERGLITTSGKTPGATMRATLYRQAHNNPELVKLEEPAGRRAKRGSVYWTLRGAREKRRS